MDSQGQGGLGDSMATTQKSRAAAAAPASVRSRPRRRSEPDGSAACRRRFRGPDAAAIENLRRQVIALSGSAAWASWPAASSTS